MERMPYDPDKDFAPISMVTRAPFLVVASSELGVNSLAELLDLARSKPATLAYASNGAGGIIHLGMELLSQEAKVKLTHVPYKGFAPALPDLVSGRTPVSMFDLASLGSFAKGGRVKILASTSATRSRLFPEVPTVAELGFPGFQVESWFTLYAPAGTPQAIVDQLNEQIRKWTAMPETVQSLAQIGQEPESSTSAYVRTRIQRERQTYAPLVKAANIKAE
jgi:tripartite-type tricarboxylate transporter receptor subunit TctC